MWNRAHYAVLQLTASPRTTEASTRERWQKKILTDLSKHAKTSSGFVNMARKAEIAR